ncbi:hypothetical protein PYJP_15640 [Pyrofollis japonicus]|nr:hypothetical protein PYJP_15640 [Pyrofollis japonicus]
MLLAVITASMAIISALIYNVTLMGSEIKKSGTRAAAYIGSSITFVDAYVNSSTSCHYIYLKNTGTYPIADLGNATIILGNETSSYLLSFAGYNTTPSSFSGEWSYVDIEKPNEIWDVSETILIIACPPTSLTPPYRLVLALPSGNTFTWKYG